MTTNMMTAELQEILNNTTVHRNLSVPTLVETAVKYGEGITTSTGALSVTTGKYTGRSPKDKFIVQDSLSQDQVHWGPVNQPFSQEKFDALYAKVLNHLKTKEELFVFDGFAGADETYRLPIRIINEYSWQNLFVHQLFIRPSAEELAKHESQFTVIAVPSFSADPAVDGTNSETFILVSFEKKVVLIGGTHYAGEMKKSIFSVMNFLLPQQGVMPMHCSANVGKSGDVALFFGLSGTGKTTLSADPNRNLIGDDEHGWSDNGVFNFEGGCYAKCIRLTQENEPEIWNAIKFGSVLENVVVDRESRLPDYDSDQLTENTRAAYPLDAIPGAVIPSVGGHPNVIVFLTADAFGVLPPIAKLTKEQAMYYFLSGYTSKLAGTERGVTEPEATFSTCFGAPFLPLAPTVYAELLGEKITKHDAKVYLVNTGWTGGGYGTGSRMKLSYTRAMVTAAIEGSLDKAQFETDPIFGLALPTAVEGVPSEVLNPRNTWENKEAYDVQAKDLASRFIKNFGKFESVSEAIKSAAPKA
ncbi:phosphoenolpyruvate carboxykinase (ATP) [Tumebacillus avium]|uniref:Phosphoenolpyruvate carboxykinase (ATP) n=1 Tax=Tumebacillus avium TaxID=1903704 RepID=A0A1Y0IQF7_9BACL|nr:phosphoenolpyruvate carboxykinase (ATP) [Tumebacillus avium]ARU62076.1 phosphoenolpyruvate carboxykinase (ATP) [Tumebacillus avium]